MKMKMKMNMGHRRNYSEKRNWSTQSKACPIATLFTTNLTLTGLDCNLGRRGDRPLNNVCAMPRPIEDWI